MDPCELFLMGDSLSFENSDLEDLLDEDIELISIILAAKEIMYVRPKKLQGSTMGRICIPLNHARGNNMLMRDYFAEVPTYPPHLFRHW
jgi:hypothetical protein